MSVSEHDLDRTSGARRQGRFKVVARFKKLSPRELRVRALKLLALAAQLDDIAHNFSEDNQIRTVASGLRDTARLLDERATRGATLPPPARA
jgi:hypothetical protein